MDDFLTLIDKTVRNRVFFKFRSIMGFSDINKDSMIETKQVAQRKRAEKNESNKLEFFNIWRPVSSPSFHRDNMVASIEGIDLPKIDTAGGVNYKLVPRDLHYSMWFWSEDKNKLNAVESVFSFWNVRHPKLDLYLDTYYPINFDIIAGEAVHENSGEEQYNKGKIFVLRLDFVVEAWILNPEDGIQDSAPQITTIFMNIKDSTNEPVYVDLDGQQVVIEGKQVRFLERTVGNDSIIRS